jgi:hypothetical protein
VKRLDCLVEAAPGVQVEGGSGHGGQVVPRRPL